MAGCTGNLFESTLLGFFRLHVSIFLKNLGPPISFGILDPTVDNFFESTVEKE